MTNTAFLASMTAAATSRSNVTGEQVDRLRVLASGDMDVRMPAGWVGTIDPANTEWAVGRAMKRMGA